MTDQSPPALVEMHWMRNLVVCVFGAFTTIVAMTLLLPFLPLYVEHLGVSEPAAIVQWSGVAFGATFLSAAITAPLWGRLGDRYGRKLMLIRASLGPSAQPVQPSWWPPRPRRRAPAGHWGCCRRGSWRAISPGR
jgi:MFS family permease